MLKENIKMAWQAIVAFKMRSALSCLGIFIGVFSIIIILTIMNGMQDYVHDQFSSLGGGNLRIRKMPMMITSYEQFMEVNKRPAMTMRQFRAIEKESIIADYVSPLFSTRSTIKFKENSVDFLQNLKLKIVIKLLLSGQILQNLYFLIKIQWEKRLLFLVQNIRSLVLQKKNLKYLCNLKIILRLFHIQQC